MTSPVSIAWRNHVEGATLASDDLVAGGDLAQLATPQVTSRARFDTGADGTAVVDIDFGADVEIGYVAWLRPRTLARLEEGDGALLGATSPVRHQLGTSQGDGSVWDSGTIPAGVAPGLGYHVHLPDPSANGSFTPVTARWARFTFQAESQAADTLVDLGLAFYGPRHDFRIGPAPGIVHGTTARGTVQRPRRSTAAITSRNTARLRYWQMPFRTQPSAELAAMEQMLEDVAEVEPVFLTLDRAAPARTTLRGLIDTAEYQRPARGYQEMPLRLTESF